MLAQTKIAPVKSAILIIYDCFNYLIINHLLSDAELGEDGLEDVGGGDFAGDFAKVVDDAADLLCEKVGWYICVHTLAGGGKSFTRALKR